MHFPCSHHHHHCYHHHCYHHCCQHHCHPHLPCHRTKTQFPCHCLPSSSSSLPLEPDIIHFPCVHCHHIPLSLSSSPNTISLITAVVIIITIITHHHHPTEPDIMRFPCHHHRRNCYRHHRHHCRHPTTDISIIIIVIISTLLYLAPHFVVSLRVLRRVALSCRRHATTDHGNYELYFIFFRILLVSVS